MTAALLALAVACAPTRPPPEVNMASTPPALRALAPTVEGRVWSGVAYGPHRVGQRPGQVDPTPEQLREDLELLTRHWTVIRMYGSRGPARTVLGLIAEEQLPLRVVVGAWISADDAEANAAEVAEAIALAREFPEQVAAVTVGNETQVSWSAHRSSPAGLVQHIRAVRAAVEQPVTTADDWGWWVLPESRTVAQEVDFLLVHAHPLWNGRQLEEAVGWTEQALAQVSATHPGRAVVLGETGWATSHDPAAPEGAQIRGVTGEAEQARFHRDLTSWVEARSLPTFWFEAFDEPWKGGDRPNEVEKHWGLYRVDRTPKLAAVEHADAR